LLLPALSRAKSRGLGAACLNNLRQMSLAGQMYIHDNRDYLVPNNPPYIGDASQPFLPTWAGLSARYGAFAGTNDAMLLGGDPAQPGIGVLGPYVKTAKIFKCPVDHSTTLGASTHRVREGRPRVLPSGGCGGLLGGRRGGGAPPRSRTGRPAGSGTGVAGRRIPPRRCRGGR
jgi:hypothetical protein